MNGDLFTVFSDPTRRRALRVLSAGPLCVCDLTAVLRLPQPTVSRHLGTLQREGLVVSEKRGKWRHYRLTALKGTARRLLEAAAAEGDSHHDVARLKLTPRRSCD